MMIWISRSTTEIIPKMMLAITSERHILNMLGRLQVLSSYKIRQSQVLLPSKRRIMASSPSRQAIDGNIVNNNIFTKKYIYTIVAGANCKILTNTGLECNVVPYSDEYESIQNVPSLTVATAQQPSKTWHRYIQVLNEAIWMEENPS